MEVFAHHVYEFMKGVRTLILHTADMRHLSAMEAQLRLHGIAYVFSPLANGRVNVFFGNEWCVDVVRRIDKPNLRELTAEEDFILGILLGYDKIQQCKRFLDFSGRGEALAG